MYIYPARKQTWNIPLIIAMYAIRIFQSATIISNIHMITKMLLTEF